MSQTERIHQIVHLLETSRRPVPIERFLEELEVSRATFKRDIEYLRDRLGAPIEWQRGAADAPRGYVLRRAKDRVHGDFSMPGLWFNQSEIYALLMMHRLATSMEPGLIPQASQTLLARIRHLLGSADDDPQDVMSRIRILQSATRRKSSPWFETIARATLRQCRLRITYFTRGRGATGEREVSPQRILHYRENWYLLAWCHQAGDLRLFAFDAVRHAESLRVVTRKVPAARLERMIGDGFGIFGGRSNARAILRFSPLAARWVADETWHPAQKSYPDGEHLVLEVPYSAARELAMEILRYGPEVEVIAPPDLRAEVIRQLEQALANYAGAQPDI